MLQPGRTFNNPTAADTSYRYGFNRKEKNDEVNGTGVDYDYGYRIYDARIGKFLSVDPLIQKYPELTPYQFASNRPIDGIDQDGLEYLTYTLVYGVLKEGQIATLISKKVVWYNAQQHNAHGSLGEGVQYNIELYDEKTKTYQLFNNPFVPRQATRAYGMVKVDYGNYLGGTELYKYGQGDGHNFGEGFSETYDYDLPAVDQVDFLAKMHDIGYDALGAKGEASLDNDWGTAPVDIAAWKGWMSFLYILIIVIMRKILIMVRKYHPRS